MLGRVGIQHARAAAIAIPSGAPLQLPLAYPVAVKALSDRIPHKSDAGGVVQAYNQSNCVVGRTATNPAGNPFFCGVTPKISNRTPSQIGRAHV